MTAAVARLRRSSAAAAAAAAAAAGASCRSQSASVEARHSELEMLDLGRARDERNSSQSGPS